jgi:hypothetical protein
VGGEVVTTKHRVEVRPCAWDEFLEAIVEFGPGVTAHGNLICYVPKDGPQTPRLIAALVAASEVEVPA